MSDFNIVVAHFGHHNRVVMTDTLYQYDYGQQLKIEGITELPQTFQAHFSNVQHGGVSITVTGINGMVDVPNSLLMTGKRIYCWIYVTETGSGETVYQILMPVQSRPMPEYYDVEDVGVFDSVVNQVAEYAATATTGATSATASATAAAVSASAAADSAENAAASEANAEASASAAQASDASAATAATTATSKAAEAAQSATSAGSAADRAEAAQEAAETAQEAAETAATSATADAATATTKATAAAASATTASTKATDATNAATTATAQAAAAEAAKTTAVEAKTAAQSAQSAAETAATTATAKATEAAASATAAAQAAASINTPDSALSDTSTNAVQNRVITSEITDVKSAITDITGATELVGWISGKVISTTGETVDFTPITASLFACIVIDCVAGDVFTLTGKSTNANYRLWCWCKNDGTIVGKPSSNLDYIAQEITAPSGAQKLVCNVISASEHSIYRGHFITPQIEMLLSDQLRYSSFNTVFALNGTNGTLNGVTFTWNKMTSSVTITGTASGTAYENLFFDQDSFPSGIETGKTLILILSGNTNSGFRIGFYNGSTALGANTYTSDAEITVPSNATGMYIRAQVSSGVTANETVSYALLNAPSNEELKQGLSALNKMSDDFYKYDYYDAFSRGNGTSATYSGITFTRNSDGTWTISGTATANTFCNIINSSSDVPYYIIPGRTYKLSFNGGTVPVRLYIYGDESSGFSEYSSDALITFPDVMTGLILRFQIANGTVFADPVTVAYTLVPVAGAEGINVNNYYEYENTINKTENITNNTYTITASPQITTDSHGWLASVDTSTSSETDKTDMTPAIMAMLTSTGYCHLGEGVFYVSGNIDMPEHSMLEGCGDKTIIRLLGSVSTGYILKMQQYCTVSNLQLSGSYSVLTPTSDGGRDAIHFVANTDGTEGETTISTAHCMLNNVFIKNFSGSGIKCHNTSINYAQGIYASDIYIHRCCYGINIDYKSEFNKFTNVCIAHCYVACVNNGGNNVFTACTFHASNTGFLLDNSLGDKPNNGHGTINGCTFCHIGSNAGSAITIKNTTAGFVIANCQIWYDSVDIEDSEGILFTGCEFGKGTTGDGATINVSGGNGVIFSGCIFNNDVSDPPDITITNNTKVRFIGCYGGFSGEEITAP